MTSLFEAFGHVLSAPWETVCVTSENIPSKILIDSGSGEVTQDRRVSLTQSRISPSMRRMLRQTRAFFGSSGVARAVRWIGAIEMCSGSEPVFKFIYFFYHSPLDVAVMKWKTERRDAIRRQRSST